MTQIRFLLRHHVILNLWRRRSEKMSLTSLYDGISDVIITPDPLAPPERDLSDITFKVQSHEIFDLWFFFIKQPIWGPDNKDEVFFLGGEFTEIFADFANSTLWPQCGIRFSAMAHSGESESALWPHWEISSTLCLTVRSHLKISCETFHWRQNQKQFFSPVICSSEGVGWWKNMAQTLYIDNPLKKSKFFARFPTVIHNQGWAAVTNERYYWLILALIVFLVTTEWSIQKVSFVTLLVSIKTEK